MFLVTGWTVLGKGYFALNKKIKNKKKVIYIYKMQETILKHQLKEWNGLIS